MKNVKNIPKTKVGKGMMIDPAGHTMIEDNLPRGGKKRPADAMKPGSGPMRPRPGMMDPDNDND